MLGDEVLRESRSLDVAVRKQNRDGEFLNIIGLLGSLVTPPALGAGELAGSNPANPTIYCRVVKR